MTQFPTILFYETGTNLRVLQQAARRSWRAVGQDKPVKVYFLAYQGIQAHILDIIAKKMRAAAVIEGTKVGEGQIASVFDDDADFTAALNNIASEIEAEFKPDFSHATIEEGKLRPPTKLEVEYESILAKVKGEKEEPEEIVEEEVVEESVAFEADSTLDIEEIPPKEIDLDDLPVKEELTSTGNRQLAFDF